MSSAEASPHANNETTSSTERIRELNHLVADHGVPTADEVLAAQEFASTITRDESTLSFYDQDGNRLDDHDAVEFLTYANPDTWLLNDEEKTKVEGIIGTNSRSELTTKQQKELASQLFRRDPSEKLDKTYGRYKEEARQRKKLSDELKARKKRKEMHSVPEPKNKAEGLGIDDLVDVEENGGGRLIHKKSKRYISDKNLQTVADMQDFIRDNTPELPTDIAPAEGVRGQAMRENGQLMTPYEVDLVKEHEDQIREGADEYAEARDEHSDGLMTGLDNAVLDLQEKVDSRVNSDAPLTEEELLKMFGDIRELASGLARAKGVAEDSEQYKNLMQNVEDVIEAQTRRLDRHEEKMFNLTGDYFEAWKEMSERVEAKIRGEKGVDISYSTLYSMETGIWDKFKDLMEAKGWPEDSDKYQEAKEGVDEQLQNLYNQYEKSRNWRDKLRDARESVGEFIGARTREFKEFFGDPEKGKKRKKIAAALGVVGVAAAGAAIFFGVEGGHAQHVAGHVGGHGHGGGKLPPNPNAAPTPETHSVTLQAGSNPWEVSRQVLQQQGIADPTNAQIMAMDQHIGALNGFPTWELWTSSVDHLRTGTQILVP